MIKSELFFDKFSRGSSAVLISAYLFKREQSQEQSDELNTSDFALMLHHRAVVTYDDLLVLFAKELSNGVIRCDRLNMYVGEEFENLRDFLIPEVM